MKPGPKPTPTRLKVLHGETRPSRLNLREPKIPDGEPAPPPGLSAAARPIWDYTLEALRGSKVLTAADRDAVASYAEHQASHDEMLKALRGAGGGAYLIRGARTGDLVKNPLVAMIRNEAQICERSRASLGLTPSARSGLIAPAEAPEELERLLSRPTESDQRRRRRGRDDQRTSGPRTDGPDAPRGRAPGSRRRSDCPTQTRRRRPRP